MNHVYLPQKIWKLLDKNFQIVEDIEFLEEKFPKNFLNYVEYYVGHEGFIRFEYFRRRGVGEENVDGYLDHYFEMCIRDREEALKRMQARLETDHAKEMAALCLAHWHEYNMWPMESMGELVRELKAMGYGIYLCSNASERLLECYRIIPGIECFDGILFSAEVKCVKPQKEMYQHLFERFHLKPEECFFIDDVMLNIEGARACGMDGYCFADGDEAALRAALKRLNRNAD